MGGRKKGGKEKGKVRRERIKKSCLDKRRKLIWLILITWQVPKDSITYYEFDRLKDYQIHFMEIFP